MRGITAAPACSQHSVGMHLLFPADVPAQSLSCYALECTGGEADDSLVRASSILHSIFWGPALLQAALAISGYSPLLS